MQNGATLEDGRCNPGHREELCTLSTPDPIGLMLIQKTSNCDQSSESESSILDTHKVLG